MFSGALRWEIYSSSALCSLLTYTVMLKKACICVRRLCMQWGMMSALQRCKPSHTAAFNPVGVWVCLRFPSGTSADSKLASKWVTDRKTSSLRHFSAGEKIFKPAALFHQKRLVTSFDSPLFQPPWPPQQHSHRGEGSATLHLSLAWAAAVAAVTQDGAP